MPSASAPGSRSPRSLTRLLLSAFSLFLAGSLLLSTAQQVFADPNSALVVPVRGAITPVTADYIRQALEQAQREGHPVVILHMDTPGGLETSMRDIVQTILASPVPVAVLVGPPGGRAASAGTFITLAAHVAAMSPNTTIGAASLVAGDGQEIDPVAREKATNDAVALIRSLAQTHGRNADWAESAVRNAVALDADSARQQNVVDLVSENPRTLLAAMDGRTVRVAGEDRTLATAQLAVRTHEATFAQRFLFTIADPNIAFLLLSLGMLALLAEVSNPGSLIPGTLGVIFLILGFFALGALPINYAGLALIVVAFVLLAAEVWVTSGGFLGVAGVVSLAIGGMLLFSTGDPAFRLSPFVLGGTVLAAFIFTALLTFVVGKTTRNKPLFRQDEFVGHIAVVRERLNPEGSVFLEGERWHAIADEAGIDVGEKVEVVAVDGMTLRVKRAPAAAPGQVQEGAVG